MEREAFEGMVRTHSADLYRFAYWLSRDRHLAQDLVQDAFSAAWKGFGSLRDRESAKPWLFSILRNEFARGFQRKRLDIVDAELDQLPVSVPPLGQERVELENLLKALPESYREPLMLQVIGGFSGREIAQMMGITEQNVMVRLTRARQALRQLADPDGGSGE
ncbi:MAG: sigma-70 family RNA polymerase sigma factor [Burkholderiales bacterium]|nr:sigma-70 family RNA polymerase sigma factor [Burkholderiales bacterium]